MADTDAILSAPTVPSPVTTAWGGSSTTYYHRAWRISTGAYVYWTYTSPDPTGAQSGVAIIDLRDIVLYDVR